jgi:hypothetical protein
MRFSQFDTQFTSFIPAISQIMLYLCEDIKGGKIIVLINRLINDHLFETFYYND